MSSRLFSQDLAKSSLLLTVIIVAACSSDSGSSDSGSSSPAPPTAEWVFDTEAPAVIDLTGPPAITNEREATFTFGCTKQDCTFECSFDGLGYEACDSGMMYAGLEDATYAFAVRAEDAQGNLSAPSPWAWTVDTTPPLILDLEGPVQLTNDIAATLDFACSKDNCVFTCELNGDEAAPCEPGVTYGDLDDGEHVFSVQATDGLGTTGPKEAWIWAVDSVVPAIEDLDGPTDPATETAAVFTFACSKEECEFTCALNGARAGIVSGATSCVSGVDYTALLDDVYTFTVYASDPAGNQSAAATWHWTIDNEPPNIAIVEAPLSETTNARAVFEFECTNEQECVFECALDFDQDAGDSQIGEWAPCEVPHLIEGLEPGEYELRVRATDLAGNQTVVTHRWRVSVAGWSMISSSWDHACGITLVGTLWCWGHGVVGQLGLGDTSTRGAPTRVGSDADWSFVSAGIAHTCGIRAGTLWCWGQGGSGQLGLGDTSNRTTPEQVGADADWASVSTGDGHTCGVRAGTLWCWGAGGWGRLGLGDTDQRLMPEQVGLDADWSSVSAGGEHTCGLRDGSLWCWGNGGYGRLGHDDSWNHSTPHQVGFDVDWFMVSAGSTHTCGIRDGSLWCWGGGGRGQLGHGSTTPRHTPARVGSGDGWSVVSASGERTCGVRDGALWCWGGWAQLGLGDLDQFLTPQLVGFLSAWSSVSTGRAHTCGLRDEGAAFCWGQNNVGQLGMGEHGGDKLVPVPLDTDQMLVQVSAGAVHGCGVDTLGKLWCWGDGVGGRLGLGDTSNRTTPEQVGSRSDWSSVSAGGNHTCGLSGGTLWCWGWGRQGQLGLGDTDHRYWPEQVGSDADWSFVSTGGMHTCGLRDGTLWCWGGNSTGQLGLGDGVERHSPVQVGAESDWSSVSAGSSHTCGVRGGTLWCWGHGGNGRLGLGSNSLHFTPEQVGSGGDWSFVSAGNWHTCGVRAGTLWCWGAGHFGQLGNGLTGQRLTPEQVGSGADWSAVTASDHTCGLRQGTLWCWGHHGYGRLGLGDTVPRRAPERVGSRTDWTTVSAGGNHTHGLRASGASWTWGHNSSGQLGDGTGWKDVPMEVLTP